MTEPESNSDDVFDVDAIRRYVELMQEHDLTEIHLRQGKQQIRLRRGATDQLTAVPMPVQPAAIASTHSAQISPPSVAPEKPADEENITRICSPMVGTFYSRPNPESPTFVNVGDHVGPETTVCVIEAMKVFNEIPAEVTGRIIAVLADNEETVDVGKPLYKVDTSG